MLWKGSRSVKFFIVSLGYHPFPWHQTRKATNLLKIWKRSNISLQCHSTTVQDLLSQMSSMLLRNEDFHWLPIPRHCSTEVSSIVLKVRNSSWVLLFSASFIICLTSQLSDGHFFPLFLKINQFQVWTHIGTFGTTITTEGKWLRAKMKEPRTETETWTFVGKDITLLLSLQTQMNDKLGFNGLAMLSLSWLIWSDTRKNLWEEELNLWCWICLLL